MMSVLRIISGSVAGCLCVFSLLAAKSGSPPRPPKAEAIEKLDVVLKRICDETLEAHQDTDVHGVERCGSKAQPSEVTKVCVSPYSCLSCGCCGEGEVPSTFSDDDMACLAPIDSITSVVIHRSKITDDGLRHLAGLSQLKNLDLSENAITDDGLKHLAGLENLETLKLDKTQITGAGLAHLSKLQKLRGLSLKNTPLTGAGLASLPELLALEWFNASKTKIDGAGLAAFRRTPNLHAIYLANTPINDVGLSHLAGLTKLQHLTLSNTKVSDAGIAYLGGLVELVTLYIQNTRVRGDGLLELGNLTKLKRLVVSCNRRYPKYSKELVAVLTRMEKLNSQLRLEVSWPNSLPPAQRQIEIQGMKHINVVWFCCLNSTETICLHNLPKLEHVHIGDLIPPVWKTSLHNPLPTDPFRHSRIGKIRIQGCKSLKSLSILLPERLAVPELESVDNLTLRGVLTAESLSGLRKINLKCSLLLDAFPGSEPSSLAVFANQFGNDNDPCRRLRLSVDVFNAAWCEQLQSLNFSPRRISVYANTIADDACLAQLAKIATLRDLKIRDVSNLDPKAITAFRKVRPHLLWNIKQLSKGRKKTAKPSSNAN